MIPGDPASKTYFANQLRTSVTIFTNAFDDLIQMQQAYISRGYDPGDTDAISDSDVAGAKITAAQIQQLLASGWLIARMNQLMTQQAVTGTIDGNGIIGKIRADM